MDTPLRPHRLFVLAAVVGLLLGVLWLSTASRSDLGFESGSHLRSLARAHRVADDDGRAIQVPQFTVRVISALPEPILVRQILPLETGVRKAVAALAGPMISRAPPAIAA